LKIKKIFFETGFYTELVLGYEEFYNKIPNVMKIPGKFEANLYVKKACEFVHIEFGLH
jgi:hypothetical protein